ncbi:ABC transporter substrate-binding protein [Salinigranum marinum]|uniref:ABC transporter substrate-binding protein n=1 Tax=Salinigranum marinum TaxID=1515595 RepID=UPI002989E211|nr:ABC transporter substrate-binding protein [Salinigranum marinum]
MRQSRRAFLATAGLGLAAGCLGGGSGESQPTSTEAAAATGGGTATSADTASPTATATPEPEPSVTDVSLLLNWKPSGLHAPYYAAKAEGFYQEEGLSLTSIESGQGSDFSAKQAGLGNTAFAITSADQVLNVNSRELSPVSVGVVMQRSPVVVFSTRETLGGEFTDPAQLAGKTVGTGPGMVRILTRLLLDRAGVLDSVEIVDTGYDTVQQLLSGKIDAAGGVFGDAVDARAQGYTTDLVQVASEVPSYGHVVATQGTFADEHPETTRAFLRATARGAAWAATNPEAATDHLVSAVPALSESRDRQRDKWTLMNREFVLSETVASNGWGWSEAAPWETMRDALADADLLGGSVTPSEVWTNDYLDTGDRYVGSYADVVSE